MHNKNKILVGCLALLLALSVGYALFSEQVTINGTANAKGNLDVTLECKSTDKIGDATGTCSVDGNTVTTASVLTKPEEEFQFYVNVINNGTIPVKIKNVVSQNNVTHDFYSAGDCYYVDFDSYFQGYYWLDTGMCDSEFESAEYVLEPGEKMELGIVHTWLDSYTLYWGSSGNLSNVQPNVPEGYVFDYDITINFEQVTN